MSADSLPVLTDLTAVEQRLIDYARRGQVLVCGDLPVDDLADDTDPSREIRATLIRELLLGRRGDLDPRGVRVQGARITGLLDLDHVQAIVGLELRKCVLPDPLSTGDAVLPWLSLQDSVIDTLHALGLRTTSNLWLAGVRLDAGGGAISLIGAHIGGYLICDGATITNSGGAALYADSLHVERNLTVRKAQIAGRGHDGALRLISAHVGGDLDCAGAKITNDTGAALLGDEARVDGNAFLMKLRARGAGEQLTISFAAARIRSQLDLAGVDVANPSGFLVDLEAASVGELGLPSDTVCPDGAASGTCRHATRIDLDGFSFAALDPMTWRQWLHLIQCHTESYRPQPYQQLAAVERAAGHDGNARRILIAQQDDLRRRAPRALGGRLTRAFHWLWGALAGYGYRARRTALALLLALLAAGVLGYAAGQVTSRPGHHAAERTVTPGVACSTVELVGLGLDRGLPLGPTGLRSRCDLDTGTGWGEAFTVAVWLVQAAVWGLATLALAGYTGLIRKTG